MFGRPGERVCKALRLRIVATCRRFGLRSKEKERDRTRSRRILFSNILTHEVNSGVWIQITSLLGYMRGFGKSCLFCWSRPTTACRHHYGDGLYGWFEFINFSRYLVVVEKLLRLNIYNYISSREDIFSSVKTVSSRMIYYEEKFWFLLLLFF